MLRIDVAGNISKRFSASGIRFARFAGVCPRWNVFAAFLTPGMIRIQLSRMPDGSAFFCIARTVQADNHGYHTLPRVHAVGLGCSLERLEGGRVSSVDELKGGPDDGNPEGGRVVASGPPADVAVSTTSRTAPYLRRSIGDE